MPSLAILDWPEMEWRIAYGSFAGRVATTKELIDLYLESAAAAKMNIVIPAYLEAVAYYMEGADGLRRGLNHQAQANLIRAIDRLHSLGIHSHEATQGFRETAKRSWIPAETLLGFEVPNQP